MTAPRDSSEDGKYAVIVSDLADVEAKSAYKWLRENVSPEYASRWLEGLLRAIEGLAVFPHSHTVAPENDRYDVEVRRLLYHGPAKRRSRGGTAYRILFHIVEPISNESEGLVRVLHIWHGSQDAPQEL